MGLRADPTRYLYDAGFTPDPWQADMLTSTAKRFILCISRQAGKSLISAAMSLKEAFEQPESLILLLSPTQRQSSELFKDKVSRLYNALGRPIESARPRDSATMLELKNGSRIVSLPGDEETVRGYSGVRLLVIDEASRVPDDLYRAVRPMLAVSGGKMLALSTPFGKRGWFFEEWHGANGWKRIKLRADECPRITKEFLEEERIALGNFWFDQEYSCVFNDTISSLFRAEDIEATLNQSLQPVDIGI